MEEKCYVPIWEKQNLTIEEAAEYSNIGQKALRRIANDPLCPFVIRVGRKSLIKRKAFDNYIEKRSEIRDYNK